MRVCLYEINFWINRLNTADCPPQTDGLHPTNWRLEQNKRMRKKGFVLFVWLSFTWDTGLLSDSEWDWNLHHQLSWFSGLWIQTGIYHQLWCGSSEHRSWDLSTSITTWGNSMRPCAATTELCASLGPVVCDKRSHDNEKPVHDNRIAPAHRN